MMKHIIKYTTSQLLVACFLWMSLFLQSCFNFDGSTGEGTNKRSYEDESVEVREQCPPITTFPFAFTSANKLNYQVLPQITVEMAQEVQGQTGLVIPFESGKTTTEFIGGKGNFGQLRLGKDEATSQYYGVKILQPNSRELEEARKEAQLQSKLNGLPHLMPIIDMGEARDENNNTVLYQVMPLASLGNGAQLADYLTNIKDVAFKEELLIHVAKSILEGFVALHRLNVAHLDFKPNNLVIDSKGVVYVIDFGCSKHLSGDGKVRGDANGHIDYFSPERDHVEGNGNETFDGKAADSWAIGVTLLELAVGTIEDKEDAANHPFVQQAQPGSYAAMVKGFLDPDPTTRLNPQAALQMELSKQVTKPETLAFLREFVQSTQWNKRKEKMGQQSYGLTSAQQLPLPHFAGYASRPELEQAVISKLTKEKLPLVACVGIGGVGKTQLLTYLVHQEAIQKGYKKIYWFQASDNETSLFQQYQGLAIELKLPGIDEKTPFGEARAALVAYLEKQKEASLLVFDNGDDPSLLKSFLPRQGRLQVLVSSRSPEWKDKISVEVFTAQQVKGLLAKLLPERKTSLEEAKLLGEAMGYLPLALNQSIAWIREKGMNVQDYVKTYEEKQKELLKTNTRLYGKNLPNSMVTLYQLQLQKLAQECPEAVTLLEYTALLAADNIPLGLLTQGLLGKEATPDTYKKAQQALLQYALWQEDRNQGSIKIHRLMQEVIRLPWSGEQLKDKFRHLATCLEAYNEKVVLSADEATRKALASHLDALSALAAKEPTLSEEGSLIEVVGSGARYYVKPQLMLLEADEQGEKGGSGKQAIELEKIFDQVDEKRPAVKRILLLGGAGAGKSTLLDHMYQQWVSGEAWKDKYTHVLRVRLRELLNADWRNKYTQEEQKELLACFIHSCLEGQKRKPAKPDSKETSYQLKDIQALLQDPTQKVQALLLVDGYDEIANLQGTELYNKLIAQGILTHPQLVMSSRPHAASKEFRAKFERQVESQGLDEVGIKQYISLQFQGATKQGLGQELATFLEYNGQVKGMCQVPINLALLCLIWKDAEIRAKLLQGKQKEQGDFQLGQLYHELLIWLGKRHNNKKKVTTSEQDRVEVSEEELFKDPVYRGLERVAYENFTGQGAEKDKEASTLGISGKELEAIAQKEDPSLKLSDLIDYGLVKGEGDQNKPLEQTYYFIHLSFQEYLAAYRFKELLSQEKQVREVATWIAHHRNDPKYLMTLKFLAGLVSQSNNALLVTRFWEAVSCNVEGVLELGLEGKINLLMHLLGQSQVRGKVDPRIPNLPVMQQLIDEAVLKDMAPWQQPIIESGYLSDKLVTRVKDILDQIEKQQDDNLLQAAANIAAAMANKRVLGTKAELFDRFMRFTQLKNWQLQKLGLEKASQVVDKGLDDQQLDKAIERLCRLLSDDNLNKSAIDLLTKLVQLWPISVVKHLQKPITQSDTKVRNLIVSVLPAMVQTLPQEASQEASNLLKLLLSNVGNYVQSNEVQSLEEPVKKMLQEKLLNLLKPLLNDEDKDVRSSAAWILDVVVIRLPREEAAHEVWNLLKPLLSEEDSNIRSHATSALRYVVKNLPQEAIQEALNLLQPLLGDTEVRFSVALVLREIAENLPSEAVHEVWNLLKPLLSYAGWQLRGVAVEAFLKGIVKNLSCGEALNLFKPLLDDEDWKVRSGAVQALREIVEKLPLEAAQEALNLLKPLLSDKDRNVRTSTINALGGIVEKSPQKAVYEVLNLLKLLLSDQESYVRSEAAETLSNIAKELPQEAVQEALNLLKPLLGDKAWEVQSNAAKTLQRIAENLSQKAVQEALNLLKPLLGDKDRNVRTGATEALHYAICPLGNSKIVEKLSPEEVKEILNLLRPLLNDTDKNIRSKAAWTLEKITEKLPPEAVQETWDLLKLLLRDEDSSVRSHATNALGEIAKKLPPETVLEAWNLLKSLLGDKFGDVQSSATNALREIIKKLPPEAVLEALNLLEPTGGGYGMGAEYARSSAAKTLAELVENLPKKLPQEVLQKALSLLKPLLGGRRYPQTRYTAVWTLVKIVENLPQEETLNLLKPLLSNQNEMVRTSAADILGKIVEKLPQESIQETWSLLKPLLGDENEQVRSSAVGALGEIVKRLPQEAVLEALNLLKPLLSDEDSSVRSHATDALIKIVEKLPQEAMQEVWNLLKPLLNDWDSSVRSKAAFALGALVKNLSSTALVNEASNPDSTIRTEAKRQLGEKLQSTEYVSQLSYEEVGSLLKLVVYQSNKEEELEKNLYNGSKRAFKQIADNINQDGIQWLNEHFSALPNSPIVQAFLKSTLHTALRGGVIDEEKSKLIIQCVVHTGITVTLDTKANKISLADSIYQLTPSSQKALKHIADEVIKNSQDVVAQQYRARKPLFVNSGSALPVAKEDMGW